MLANLQQASVHSGSLGKDVHLPATFLNELLNFIFDELPRWRDRPERKTETAETSLSAQLCAHLNSSARLSVGWDILQFRTQVPDEQKKNRLIDLVPSPSAAIVWVEGRKYVDFDPLMPIECKRLPTPKGDGRDDREYVFNQYKSTGGIQRFKAGHHGGAHELGAMIGYIQQETCIFWNNKVADWINNLISDGQAGWTANDLLHIEQNDMTRRTAILASSHAREKDKKAIRLRHLWIQMT